jgi:FkbM family methyltransferase
MKLLPIDLSHPLVAGAKLQAIFRFVKWQIKSRIFSRDFIHEWVDGSKFYVKKSETGLTQNIYVGLHEFSDMCFLLHLLRKEDRFIDVGANSGSYSILAGSVIGAKVLALEPIPSTYSRLVANFNLNCIESPSKAMNVGLGSLPGSLYMTSSLDTRNQIIFNQDSVGTIRVDIKTLDLVSFDLIPTLIKIDVEGWESEVIRGGFETLRKPSLVALILELNESGERYGYFDNDILEVLNDFGFQPHSYDPFRRTLQQLPGKNSGGGNTIFIKNQEEVIRRIKTAPKREILGNWI